MHSYVWASQMVLVVRNQAANAGDIRKAGLILWLGRSPEGGHGSPLQLFLPRECHGQRSPADYSP